MAFCLAAAFSPSMIWEKSGYPGSMNGSRSKGTERERIQAFMESLTITLLYRSTRNLQAIGGVLFNDNNKWNMLFIPHIHIHVFTMLYFNTTLQFISSLIPSEPNIRHHKQTCYFQQKVFLQIQLEGRNRSCYKYLC